ncbi:hypothetical protein [Macrococcus animalis]|uniref:hypothetical protein n=1 Tax=Macrococcus animalis TaxID=3395467 RepID=UPI0039BDDCE9
MLKYVYDEYFGGSEGVYDFLELSFCLIIPSIILTPIIGIPIGLAVHFMFHLEE